VDTDFKLHSKIVSVIDQVTSQVVRGRAVLDDQRLGGVHRHSDCRNSIVRVHSEDLPGGVVDVTRGKANFLVSGETGVDLGADLARMEVALFVDQVGVRDEFESFSVPDDIVQSLIVGLLNDENRPGYRALLLVCGSGTVGLFMGVDLV
jgi:hypothetical protein